MVKTIYVDMLFLINFIINYLILFASARIASARIRRLRLLASAAIGAIYGVAAFLPELSFFTSLAAKLFFSVLMILCAFGKSQLIRRTLVFLGVSFAFGGIVFAASLLGVPNCLEVSNGIYYISISLPALLLSALFAYVLLYVIFRRSATSSCEKISRIYVFSNGRSTEFSALRDTGNSLRNPMDNAPVVISDYMTLRDILPPDARDILDGAEPSSFPLLLDRLSPYGDFHLIPYKTVGVEFSLMLAFRADKIIFDKKEERGALVAISPQKVSDGKAYSAIY